MPRIELISALTYGRAGAVPRDVSAFLAPPYDVLSAPERAALQARSPQNAVHVDLPVFPLGSVPVSAQEYRQARETLGAWKASGAVTPATEQEGPGVFVARQTFAGEEGHLHRRLSILAGVPLTEPGADGSTGSAGDDSVLDHELTNAHRLADRLALLRALSVQTSPVYGLYNDPHGQVEDCLREIIAAHPPSHAGMTPEGTLHELWPVPRERQSELIERFGNRRLIIADGHNRYFAALEYWRGLAAANPGLKAGQHKASKCFVALTAHQDPGLTIRAIHRRVTGIPGFSIPALEEAARGVFDVQRVECGPEGLLAATARARFENSHAMGIYDPTTRHCAILTTTEPDPLAERFAEKPVRWRHLDTVVCDHLLIEGVLAPLAVRQGGRLTRGTFLSMRQLQDMCGSGAAPTAAIFLLPLKLADVEAISLLGELMPPESSLFWPKVATGLVYSAVG